MCTSRSEVVSEPSAHYDTTDVFKLVVDALQSSGKDLRTINVDDLAVIDQFHTRGKFATQNLSELAKLKPEDWVLDVGSGLGGPARYVASTCGGRVLGIDLSEQFTRVATALSKLVRLDDKVTFVCGDATRLPFPDATFSVVWTQHVSMNIADKGALFREMARVLRTGGRLVLSDAVRGASFASGEFLYPVPWASSLDHNHLISADELRSLAAQCGLEAVSVSTKSAEAVQLLSRARTGDSSAEKGGKLSLGMHLVLGPQARTMVDNLRTNLQAGRVEIIDALFVKTSAGRRDA